MIYNSLFRKDYDKRIIMKKFIEVQRRERLRSFHSSSSSPKKKRKVVEIKDDSSPEFTPFVKKATLPPSRWGELEDIIKRDDEILNSKEMKKISSLKRELNDISKNFKANDIHEFKKQIGIKDKPKLNGFNGKISSKFKNTLLKNRQSTEGKLIVHGKLYE